MTKPLTTVMWCAATKVGTRWQINPHMMSRTKTGATELVAHSENTRPVKFIKVRITEVQTAGYSPSRRK